MYKLPILVNTPEKVLLEKVDFIIANRQTFPSLI